MSTSPPPSADAPSADAPAAEASGNAPPAAARPSWWPNWNGFEAALITGGFILFLVLLYEMEVPPQEDSFLNPPLVAIAGVVLLWPLRNHRAVRALLLSGGVLLLLWGVDKASAVLIPFAGVYLLAYLLNPAVEHLGDRYRVPRWLTAGGITLVIVGILALFVFILVPNIADQLNTLSTRLLDTIGTLRGWLASSSLLDRLEAAGLLNKQDVLSQIQQLVQSQTQQLPDALQRLLRSLGSVLGVVTLVALVPVLLFYTLRDYGTIRDTLIELFPTAGGRRDYLVEAGGVVGRYLRGQLLISLIAAFNVSVLLFLFDVPFWLLIGLMAGVLNLIPNLGAVATLVIGGVIAFVFGGWIEVLVVALVLLGQGLLEQSVLTPNILSYQVGLHPVLVLFSLLVFGAFLGIFGLFIAVPSMALLVTFYRAYREELTLELKNYTRHGPPPPTPSEDAAAPPQP